LVCNAIAEEEVAVELNIANDVSELIGLYAWLQNLGDYVPVCRAVPHIRMTAAVHVLLACRMKYFRKTFVFNACCKPVV
jgi:hypothetical protein